MFPYGTQTIQQIKQALQPYKLGVYGTSSLQKLKKLSPNKPIFDANFNRLVVYESGFLAYGDIRANFADGYASIYIDGVDLTEYQDGHHRITLIDLIGRTVSGYICPRRSEGPNLITNGTFDTDLTGWTDSSTGWSQSAGKAEADGVTSGYLYQTVPTIAGRLYKVTGTLSNNVYCGVWDTAPTSSELSTSALTRSGSWSFYFVAKDTTSTIAFSSASSAATLDDVEIHEIKYPESASELLETSIMSARNPGFETAGAGDPDFFAIWSEEASAGTIEDEGSIVHSGSHAVKLTGSGEAIKPRVLNTFTQVKGWLYKLSAWARGDGTNSGRMTWYDGGSVAHFLTDTKVDIGFISTSYAEYNWWGASREGGSGNVQCEGPLAVGGVAYFDDINIYPVSCPPDTGVFISSSIDHGNRNWSYMNPSIALTRLNRYIIERVW